MIDAPGWGEDLGRFMLMWVELDTRVSAPD